MMHEESPEQIETQLIRLRPPQGAPVELRDRVLSGVRRELTAARWERRLARAAVVLVALGAGMNLSLGLLPSRPAGDMQVAGGLSREALVSAGVSVAEATDAKTGQQFARHLAILSGAALTAEEGAALDTAIERSIFQTHNSNPEKAG